MPEVTEYLPLSLPRDRIQLVAQVRSTLLTASVRSLQTRGDFERYLAVLPVSHHGTMTQMVAATWVRVSEEP